MGSNPQRSRQRPKALPKRVGGETIANTFKAMFEVVIGLVLAGVLFSYIKTISSDTNTPAAVIPIVALLGILFILGLAYAAAKEFGMVKGTK